MLSLGLRVGVTALQVVFPQETEHRLGWWKNRWAYRYRYRRRREEDPHHQSRAGGAGPP
ncbi:hypothetical protein [Streptomyces sp. CA-106131]|uniref:hypothetical protein n=1 Tax=Streptomyces sp. CA-106131 TaxID=3240045 RepID=UPI003D8AFCDF